MVLHLASNYTEALKTISRAERPVYLRKGQLVSGAANPRTLPVSNHDLVYLLCHGYLANVHEEAPHIDFTEKAVALFLQLRGVARTD